MYIDPYTLSLYTGIQCGLAETRGLSRNRAYHKTGFREKHACSQPGSQIQWTWQTVNWQWQSTGDQDNGGKRLPQQRNRNETQRRLNSVWNTLIYVYISMYIYIYIYICGRMQFGEYWRIEDGKAKMEKKGTNPTRNQKRDPAIHSVRRWQNKQLVSSIEQLGTAWRVSVIG